MGSGQHGTRRRPPARVLAVPPPGGPPSSHRSPPPGRPGAPAAPASAPRPRVDARRSPPRHRKQTVHLTRRGWVVVRVGCGVLMTAVIGVTWSVAGHGGQPAGATALGQAGPLRTAPASVPTPVATALRADGVPVVVAAAVAAAGGDVSVAVYDAGAARAWTYLDAPKVEASVSKLQLLGAELRAVGTATPGATVQATLARMIENSDNGAADAIFGRVGRGRVTDFDTAVGATSVVANDDGEFGLDTSTAADEVAVMRAFAYPNAVLPDAARARADALLAQVESDQRWGASGGVPAGVEVLVKNGWLPVADQGGRWAVNTVAHVSGQGRDYVVAIMSSGNATEQAGIDRLEAVSAAVWASAAR